MVTIYVIYGISTLSIILGFIALLMQKTYIDTTTMKPTEVEVPILGKLKTNYPALVFVFLGFVAILFAFDKFNKLPPVEWNVSGEFQNPTQTKINWREGEIVLRPSILIDYPQIDDKGRFNFRLNIPEGRSFEDVIERIFFTLDSASVEPINTNEEFKKCNSINSLLKTTKKGRHYSKIQVQPY